MNFNNNNDINEKERQLEQYFHINQNKWYAGTHDLVSENHPIHLVSLDDKFINPSFEDEESSESNNIDSFFTDKLKLNEIHVSSLISQIYKRNDIKTENLSRIDKDMMKCQTSLFEIENIPKWYNSSITRTRNTLEKEILSLDKEKRAEYVSWWRDLVLKMTTTAEELCRKLKPILGQKIDNIWFAYLAEDYKGKREIENFLHILYAKTISRKVDEDKILLMPPPKSLCRGDYTIGNVKYNEKECYPFGLKESDWIQHVGIFGRSGSGKTNTVFKILKTFMDKRKPFLIFDWKRNYRDLLADSELDILVFTLGRNISKFWFNPLIPPKGTDPRTWLKKLIEIIAHAYFLGEGVMYLLQKAIDSVYRNWDIYNGNKDNYPTMQEVLNWLEKYPAKGREAQWMSSTLRALGVLCFGETGKILNVNRQFGIKELLNKNVILELDALTNSDKVFLIESLLLWIHHYRLFQGGRETFKHAIIIEEAHHILLKQKMELSSGEAITDVILREIRELGESIILIDQHPSLISLPALGNTYCTIAMNLKHRTDVNTIGDAMLLEIDEKKYLGKLEVGQAIIKLQGRWFKPFQIEIPEKDIPEISDKDKVTNGNTYNTPLPEQQKSLLIDIFKNPFTGVVERYRRLNISRRSGNSLKNSLLKKDIVRQVDIPTKTGRVVLIEPSEKGDSLLKELGYKSKRNNRHGSLIHEYWRYKIGKYYEKKGFNVSYEKSLNGKTVDIFIKNGTKKIALEIETCKSNPLANIEKCLKYGYDSVISIPTSKDCEEKIRNQLKAKGLDKNTKIRVVHVFDFRLV
jgi:hypothetical protein